MLKSIRLQNFFGFQDCTINLEKGENVLVGINGSGKSNFFKAIKLLKEAAKGRGIRDLVFDEFGGFERILFSGNEKKHIELTFEFDTIDMFVDGFGLFYQLRFFVSPNKIDYYITEKIWRVEHGEEGNPVFLRTRYDITVPDDVTFENKKVRVTDETETAIAYYRDHFEEVNSLIKTIDGISIYDSFNLSKIKQGAPHRIENYLLFDGSNLASILNDITIRNKSSYKNIVDSLKNVNSNYTGIHTKQNTSIIELWLEEEKLESSIPATNISDGTLRFLCLMAILYNPNRGSVICIDEPELGLHPDMLHTLHEAIKYAAQTSQVIISTHSPLLLDWFDFENVRVFEKDDNNATIVKQLDREHYKGWYDTYMLGDMWLKGDIGGKRW